MIKFGSLSSLFLPKILGTEINQEGICIICLHIPHHTGIGRHFHDKFPQVTSVHHRESQRTARIHITIVCFHLPGAFCRSQMRTGRSKLEVHVIPQFHLLCRIECNQIIVRIVISPSRNKSPKHILTRRRLQITLSQQVREFIIEGHSYERILFSGCFFYHSQLYTNHTVNHLCTLFIICRSIGKSCPKRLVVYTTKCNLPQIFLFITTHRFYAILPKFNKSFLIRQKQLRRFHATHLLPVSFPVLQIIVTGYVMMRSKYQSVFT